jgi:hypothetical protein
MIWINSRLALRGFEEAYDLGSKSRGSILNGEARALSMSRSTRLPRYPIRVWGEAAIPSRRLSCRVLAFCAKAGLYATPLED